MFALYTLYVCTFTYLVFVGTISMIMIPQSFACEISLYLGMAVKGNQPFKTVWLSSLGLVVVCGIGAMHKLWRTTRSAGTYVTWSHSELV